MAHLGPELSSSLFHIDICVPYYRIIEITKCISETIINQFEKFKCFIPGSSRKGIFTAIAQDNIDLKITLTSIHHPVLQLATIMIRACQFSNFLLKTHQGLNINIHLI